uniref:retinitis pigmentosa 9 protein homolog n=1 Tax=Ciona intestinalis TaxID=7719 RepID=UPI000180B270|nr:retinitis pigmentosa 9 protein homolog [Ciona intestinalis]|eukprot:XP_026696422.1 retinitis pigmentosa 9 protein homolog [Ciona intestinalis]
MDKPGSKMDEAIINRMKHFETFYEQAPPGMVKEREEAPEECIPDTDGNREAREFLANAPKKGLWMPLGKEVKVMQCWRCKNYGHRTGDRECPLFQSGNAEIEKFRAAHEDPMHGMLDNKAKAEQENKLRFLQQMLEGSTSDEDSSSKEESPKRKKKKTKKKKEKWVEKETLDKSSSSKKKKKKDKEKISSNKHKRNADKSSSDDECRNKNHKSKKHKSDKTHKKKHKAK